MKIFDIAVVGAGFVGTPLARALSAQGWSLALLDAGNDARETTAIQAQGLAQRCTAINLGTQRWFDTQGLWSLIAEDACPIECVHISHKGYFGSTRLHANDLDTDAVGFVLNNDVLNSILLEDVKNTDVHYMSDARVKSVSVQDSAVTIETSELQVKARLLLAADGVSSVVRESAGIDTQQVDYEQMAVLSTLRLSQQHQNVAYERFTASGPLALLPRPDTCMSVVDCIDPSERDAIAAMSDAQYLQRLQKRFGYRLGRFEAVGARFFTPLIKIEAAQQVGDRIVLLGNAMRLLHPIGGQGYNLAMRDVAELCAQLNDRAGTDPGNANILDAFLRARRADQRQIVRFTDILARSFRGQASLPGHLRAMGLISLDTLSPLRRQFARRTMGIA
jgi:2-octaprenyl-6-methoxyphenol hydroxylase